MFRIPTKMILPKAIGRFQIGLVWKNAEVRIAKNDPSAAIMAGPYTIIWTQPERKPQSSLYISSM